MFADRLQVFFMLFVSPLAGWLFDNYGPRLPVFIGTILHVFGLMMASLSAEYYQFVLSQSVCSGIGASLILAPSMTAVCLLRLPTLQIQSV
jgi:MFS family permease